MYRERIITIVSLFALALLLSAEIVNFELSETVVLVALGTIFAGAGYWLYQTHVQLWKAFIWLVRNIIPVIKSVLRSSRISHLWLSFFLLLFAISQSMIVEMDVGGGLYNFSEAMTGNQIVSWVAVFILGCTGIAVYVFREKQWVFYTGISEVAAYVLILLYTTATGRTTPLALLAALYLVYGAGGNVLVLISYINKRETARMVAALRRDLASAEGVVKTQAAEIQALRDEVRELKREDATWMNLPVIPSSSE